jgi:hypothetical protein
VRPGCQALTVKGCGLRFSAEVLHGADGDSQTVTHAAVGSGCALQQAAAAQGRLFPGAAGNKPGHQRKASFAAASMPRDSGAFAEDRECADPFAGIRPFAVGEPGVTLGEKGEVTMPFMMLLPAPVEAPEKCAVPDAGIVTAMRKYDEEMRKVGVLLSEEGLHPTSKGARIRVSGGKRIVTDGPFNETKEVIASGSFR